MVGVVSWVGLRRRLLGRAVAVLGLVVAAAQLLSVGKLVTDAGVFTAAMYVSLLGWFLWPALVALDLTVSLLRGRRVARARAS